MSNSATRDTYVGVMYGNQLSLPDWWQRLEHIFIEQKSHINSVMNSVMKVGFPHMISAMLWHNLTDWN